MIPVGVACSCLVVSSLYVYAGSKGSDTLVLMLGARLTVYVCAGQCSLKVLWVLM